MQDRPTRLELLDAVRQFLTTHVVPALDGGAQFHARVAANVLAIVGRELRDADASLRAEWGRLVALDSGSPSDAAPPSEHGALCDDVVRLSARLAARIRAGEADRGPFRAAVLAHLRATVDEKLRIANPSYLEEA
jgi:hypothetical protein